MGNTTKGVNMKLSRWTSSLAFAVIASLSSFAHAADLKLGTPSYGGNGCPGGTASVTVSDDSRSVSVLFDAYSAEAGGTTGRRVDRKSCNLSIPVRIPQGYSVAIIGVDYRGFNAIPGAGAYTKFDTEYFWAGVRGPRATRQFNGPQADNFLIHHDLIASSLVWSRCGADEIFRINTSAMAMANSRMDQTMMLVDSADISAGIIYQLQWRSCN